MKKIKKQAVLCLMGPTASGKTPLSLKITERLPTEIISVDSAMVYRGMDIGTAKPDPSILQKIPHHLIDILDPKEIYSAGQFYQDALHEIALILAKGKIPLLVGGTMLYFRLLQQGVAALPTRNPTIRLMIEKEAEKNGWESLHAKLSIIDPNAAKKIHPHDSQRIQRALEVYQLTGKPFSLLQADNLSLSSHYQFYYFALMPHDRDKLHQQIALRFEKMLQRGFIDEVKMLYERGDLSLELPSIRSLGYRQVWSYLAGLLNKKEMQEKAIAATRQLAKRQITWLRSWQDVIPFEVEEHELMIERMKKIFNK